MGFVILLGYLAYGIVTIVLMIVGGKIAKRYGKPADLVWIIVFFTSFLFVFWDTVPTVWAHKHYCARDYGFREFKSLEQWKRENPGVAETLVPIEKNDFEERDNVEIRHLNPRFDWQREPKTMFLSVYRSWERLVDTKTGDVLGEYVDYFAGMSPVGGEGLLWLKFWLYRPGCQSKVPEPEKRSFSDMWNNAKRIGGSL